MPKRNDLELIVDKNGNPLPQRYNPVTGEMELEDGTTQLTGRNVEEVVFLNAVAIADTSTHTKKEDISRYTDMTFVAVNTLDQDIEVWYQVETPTVSANTTYTYDGSSFSAPARLTIPSGSSNVRYYFKSSDIRLLFPCKVVNIIAGCSTAPTSGVFTLVGLGEVN